MAACLALDSRVPYLRAMANGGMHTHRAVNRDAMTTSLDGEHTHTFELPDGTVVETEPGGAHSHVLHSGKANHTTGGGTHAHKIKMPGMDADAYLVTDADGWHEHETDVDSVPMGGMHSHALWLPSGALVFSQTPGDTKKGRKKGADRKRMTDGEQYASAMGAAAAALQTLKGLREATPEATPEVTSRKSRDDEDWSWANKPDLSTGGLPATNPYRSK